MCKSDEQKELVYFAMTQPMVFNRERKRCKTLTEFKLQTNAIILQINNQLAAGFINLQLPHPTFGITPLDAPTTGDNVRYYTPLVEVIDLYENDRRHELTATTMRSYSCFCKQFKQWLQKNYPNMTASMFTQVHANQYMEFVLDGNNSKGKKLVRKKIKEDRVSPRTYNNNLKLARALFSWALEKSYVRTNPFEKLKTKKEQGKERTIIPKSNRDKIVAYFLSRLYGSACVTHCICQKNINFILCVIAVSTICL